MSDVQPASAAAAAAERLARAWFTTVEQGAFDRLVEFLHDDVELVSRVRSGETFHGREDAGRFILETVASSLYEASADVFIPLGANRVIVEGRMRWMDDERVIRDDPVVWALEFENDLLIRFVPARTVVEAETILTSSR